MVAVRGFERIEFDVPSGPDSDGFLFQYGEVNWFSEPTFTLGFVRQLEIFDAKEGSVGYLQVNIEYGYRIDADLESLESRNSWWFRNGVVLFDEWLESVKADPVWMVVREKIPRQFYVYRDLV